MGTWDDITRVELLLAIVLDPIKTEGTSSAGSANPWDENFLIEGKACYF